MCRVFIRRWWVYLKSISPLKRVCLVLPPLVLALLLWPKFLWSLELLTQHYGKNRSLQHYMTHVQILIEPSYSPCGTGSLDYVPVIIMVASTPDRIDRRQAVRETWGKYQPTYFILGIDEDNEENQLVLNHQEANHFGDIIVFDFHEHYQNLTLKTALMMKWTLAHCPHAQFMLKTNDDVLVNPWMLNNVLQNNAKAQLVGYRFNNTPLSYEYIPRWLLPQQHVSSYLCGTGYLIKVQYIEAILKKAYEIPITKREDVYFTHLVAAKELGLTLTHDRRLNPSKPWLNLGCIFWSLALMHSFSPEELLTAWYKIEHLVVSYGTNDNVCFSVWAPAKMLINQYSKVFGTWDQRQDRRRKSVFLVPPLLIAVLVLLSMYWWFTIQSSKVVLPRSRLHTRSSLYFRRSLQQNMADIEILIEPPFSPCADFDDVPVIILVNSPPHHFNQRQAVRLTWGPHQPTFFILGLEDDENKHLANNFAEAKEYYDIIIFKFHDHYQNLALKTALMIKWSLDRCPQAEFLFKTDDNVLVNPWTLSVVLQENFNAQIVGYNEKDSYRHRDKYDRRWRRRHDEVSKNLNGSGYLINADKIKKILNNGNQMPIFNFEDAYFSTLVAHKKLGLNLTHDRRLSPYKPWLKLGCVYWGLATVKSFGAEEMLSAWTKLESVVDGYNNSESVCRFFNTLYYIFGDFLLY